MMICPLSGGVLTGEVWFEGFGQGDYIQRDLVRGIGPGVVSRADYMVPRGIYRGNCVIVKSGELYLALSAEYHVRGMCPGVQGVSLLI